MCCSCQVCETSGCRLFVTRQPNAKRIEINLKLRRNRDAFGETTCNAMSAQPSFSCNVGRLSVTQTHKNARKSHVTCFEERLPDVRRRIERPPLPYEFILRKFLGIDISPKENNVMRKRQIQLICSTLFERAKLKNLFQKNLLL